MDVFMYKKAGRNTRIFDLATNAEFRRFAWVSSSIRVNTGSCLIENDGKLMELLQSEKIRQTMEEILEAEDPLTRLADAIVLDASFQKFSQHITSILERDVPEAGQ